MHTENTSWLDEYSQICKELEEYSPLLYRRLHHLKHTVIDEVPCIARGRYIIYIGGWNPLLPDPVRQVVWATPRAGKYCEDMDEMASVENEYVQLACIEVPKEGKSKLYFQREYKNLNPIWDKVKRYLELMDEARKPVQGVVPVEFPGV